MSVSQKSATDQQTLLSDMMRDLAVTDSSGTRHPPRRSTVLRGDDATGATAAATAGAAAAPPSEFEARLAEKSYEISAQDRKELRSDTINYDAQRMIGHGSFGAVFLARVAETNEIVAIKKVLQDRRFKNRELQIMRQVSKQPHPYVVNLCHHFVTKGPKHDDVYLNLVLEYVPETVYSVQRQYNRNKENFPIPLVKVYMYQLSRALAHIHGMGICHRDIKPQNLLVDPARQILKLCDFGSAKVLMKGEPNIAYICSRYYRAPELIFGSTDYNTAVDVWSQGCVMAEMLKGSPLFPGASGVDQLVEIIKVLGTPSKEELRAMNPNYQEFRFPQIRPHPWATIFRASVPADAIDLARIMLSYTPSRRCRAIEACGHPFFNDLRSPTAVMPDGTPMPQVMFQFTEEELALAMPDLVQALVPPHIPRRPPPSSIAATASITPEPSVAGGGYTSSIGTSSTRSAPDTSRSRGEGGGGGGVEGGATAAAASTSLAAP